MGLYELEDFTTADLKKARKALQDLREVGLDIDMSDLTGEIEDELKNRGEI